MRKDELIKTALGTLKPLGIDAGFDGRRPGRHDGLDGEGTIRLQLGRTRLAYVAVVHAAPTPATLGALATQLRQIEVARKQPVLLITGPVTPPLAERLKDLGRQFVDGAGNAWLKAGGVLVWIVGRRPVARIAAEREGRAFTTAGLKTLFALLCDPDLAAGNLRRIAKAAGVALGAVPDILADLQRQAHLTVVGRNRRLVGTKRLLDAWAMAYARRLRPKTLARTLVAPRIDDWERWNLGLDDARWGGEPAARLLTRQLVPGILTIYAAKPPARLIIDRRLNAAAPGAREQLVEIRTPFWGEALPIDAPRRDVVPPVLVYADLLAAGDARCLETAALIHERFLARLFPAP